MCVHILSDSVQGDKKLLLASESKRVSYISQCSVAIRFRSGGIFTYDYVKNRFIAASDGERICRITVKPLNLAAVRVGEFTCKIILAPFILASSNHIVPTLCTGSHSIFVNIAFQHWVWQQLLYTRTPYTHIATVEP